MLTTLKDLAGAIALPTLLLYVVGFLYYGAYFSHFEFWTFDITNPAYLLFGVPPTIGLAIAVSFAVYLGRHISGYHPTTIWMLTDWRPRFKGYAVTLGGLYAASLFYRNLITLSYESTTRLSASAVEQATSQDDIIGRFLEFVNIGPSTDPYSYRLLATFLIIAIAMLVLAVMLWLSAQFVFVFLVRGYRKLPERAKSFLQRLTFDGRLFIGICDAAVVGLCAFLVFWSVRELHHHVVDVSNFKDHSQLDLTTVFAWLFSTTFAIWGFSFGIRWPAVINFDLATWFMDPIVMPIVLGTLIVPVVLSIFGFGMIIFPKVPFAIGGGSPRQVVIHLKRSEEAFAPSPAYLIGEDSQSLFLINEQGASLQIARNTVAYIEVKK